ncbi:MAG TPA: PA2779 family protein [Burkholderiales bacterium]|nr:PA2779 family protein [Burkholderiales bacterium]
MRNLVLAVLLFFGLAVTAHAGMIGTPAQEPNERERVKAMLERPEVVQQMEKMGIAQKDAVDRVNAMTDAEVLQLAGKLDALPAGGLSNQEWLMVIIVILLIIIIL